MQSECCRLRAKASCIVGSANAAPAGCSDPVEAISAAFKLGTLRAPVGLHHLRQTMNQNIEERTDRQAENGDDGDENRTF